jgi:hypothetical protein
MNRLESIMEIEADDFLQDMSIRRGGINNMTEEDWDRYRQICKEREAYYNKTLEGVSTK